jgi:hypothetical protein
MLLSIGGLAFTSVLLLGRRLTAHTNWLDTLWTRLSQAASNLNTVNCPTAPLLFLRTTGDEIALALAGLQLMAYVSNVTSSLFARIMGSVMRAASTAWAKPWSRLVLVCLGASLIVALFMCGTLMGRYEFPLVTVAEVLNPFGRGWMLTVTGSEVVDAWLTFTFEGLLTAAAVIMASVGFLGIALVCALVSVTVLSTFTLWAFGSFSPVAALALEMAAEPVPRGTHEFVHLSWENGSSARQKDGFSLRHSAPYEDPEALDAVVAWSRRRLDNAQLHTPVQA